MSNSQPPQAHFPATAEDLNRPFPVEDLSKLPRMGNPSYVKWQKLVERLNTEFGPENWTCESTRSKVLHNEVAMFRGKDGKDELYRLVTAESAAKITITKPDGQQIVREASSMDSKNTPYRMSMGGEALEFALKSAATSAFKKAVSMLGQHWNAIDAGGGQANAPQPFVPPTQRHPGPAPAPRGNSGPQPHPQGGFAPPTPRSGGNQPFVPPVPQNPPQNAPQQGTPTNLPNHIVEHFRNAVSQIPNLRSYDECHEFLEKQREQTNQYWNEIPDELQSKLKEVFTDMDKKIRSKISEYKRG